jgi:hypothetical protein
MPAMATRLLLDERITADGHHAKTHATFDQGRFVVHDDDGAAGALSLAALERVMQKYGLPLDEEIDLARDGGEALELGEGRRLRRFRYHAIVDAEGRDYLVWEAPNEPPKAVIATHATAALRYLVSRLATERSSEN